MGSRGFFTELYKPIFREKGTLRSPFKTVQMDMVSKFSADMNSYALACETDPDLKSFDSSLHERTNKVISLLARKKGESLPLDSLVGVSKFLLDLHQRAIQIIVDCKEDVLMNQDLRSLVDVYFNSTTKTTDLCNSMEICAKKADIGQLIIRYAMKQFEKESLGVHDTDLGENKKKYPKTLEELNKFKAMGDPFDNDFFTQFQSVYEHQILLLQELRKKREKHGKKQRNVKSWMMLSNVVFATAFVSVLVLSVVAAAAPSPPVVTALEGVLTSPIGHAGKWLKKMWKDYEKAVKTQSQSGLVLSLEKGTKVNVEAVETIRVQVDILRNLVESIHGKVEFAVEREEEEEALGLAMQELKDNVEEFCRKINEVGVIADRCSTCIAEGRLTLIEHIAWFPAN